MTLTLPLFTTRAPRATLFIRLMVGVVFLSEGIQKFLYPAALGVGRFARIGIPAPAIMAPFVGVVEIVSGALVLVGCATRLAALPLIVDMLVAIATTKLPLLASQGIWAMAHEARTDWSMLLGSCFLLLAGAGPWSIDAMLRGPADEATPTRAQPGGSAAVRAVALAIAVFGLVACAPAAPASRAGAYTPQVREITVTTVPLLVKEARNLYPFLQPAFGKGGVLEGKELYAFAPSSITVVEGDTIHFTFLNPEDDVHSFVLPDLAVSLPGGSTTRATYVARRAGLYPFVCAVQAHLPMMSGQLVVLSPAAVTPARRDSATAAR